MNQNTFANFYDSHESLNGGGSGSNGDGTPGLNKKTLMDYYGYINRVYRRYRYAYGKMAK
jgi:hypothetical protein